MMAAETPHRRAVDALAMVSDQYALSADLDALQGAGEHWQPLAVAMLAEAVAALLLDIRPRPGTVERRRR